MLVTACIGAMLLAWVPPWLEQDWPVQMFARRCSEIDRNLPSVQVTCDASGRQIVSVEVPVDFWFGRRMNGTRVGTRSLNRGSTTQRPEEVHLWVWRDTVIVEHVTCVGCRRILGTTWVFRPPLASAQFLSQVQQAIGLPSNSSGAPLTTVASWQSAFLAQLAVNFTTDVLSMDAAPTSVALDAGGPDTARLSQDTARLSQDSGIAVRVQPTALPSAPAVVGAARLVRTIASMQAVVRDGVLYSVSADTRSVMAVSLATQRDLWQTVLRPRAEGTAELTVNSQQTLLVHAGNELLSLDRTTGTVLARHPVRWNSAHQRAHIWNNNGACALNFECQLQPVHCTSGTPLGTAFVGPEITFHGDDEMDATPSCMMHQRIVVGTTTQSSLYIVSANALAGIRAEGAYLIARDLRDGHERFRRQITDESVGLSIASLSPDKTRVLYAYQGQSRQLTVVAANANDGQILWRWVNPNLTPTAQVVSLASMQRDPRAVGLLVRDGTTHMYEYFQLDGQRGRMRWRARDVAGALPLPQNVELPETALMSLADVTEVTWRNDRTANTESRTTIPTGASLQRTVGGAGYEVTWDRRGYDNNGAVIPAGSAPMVLDVWRGNRSQNALVFIRQNASVVAELNQDGWWLGEARVGTGVVAAVFEWRRGSFGAVNLYSVELAPTTLSQVNATGRQTH